MKKTKNKFVCTYLLLFIVSNFYGQDAFFNVFDNLGITPTPSQGTSSLTIVEESDNWSMGTEWTDQPWDEEDVFHAELNHTSNDLNWSIRIGKGGQLYSWNLNGTGELIPPQGGGAKRSAWVDEVVLQTWRDSENYESEAIMDGAFLGNTFVHGAGMYVREDIDPVLMDEENPFYHPMFAEKFDSSNRSYSCLNWGPVVTPSINRGDVMLYANYRHLGDNVLEITFYGYNFGDNTYNDIAMPWAMVRNSVFPNTIKSMPDGNSFEQFEGFYPTRFTIKDEGGWIAKTENVDNSSGLTISTVHGLDKHYGESWHPNATLCSSGTTPVVNSTRDITIMTAFNNGTKVAPGEGFFKRFYMVLGEQDDVIQKSYQLVDNVEYGYAEFSELNTDLIPLYTTTVNGQNILTNTQPTNNSNPISYTYSMPVKNSKPLFLMKNNDNDLYYLSTDPYAICSKKQFVGDVAGLFSDRSIYQPYDGKTEWVAMLGYVMPSSDALITQNTATLSSIIGNNYGFLAGEKYASNDLLVRTDNVTNTTSGLYEAENAIITNSDIKTSTTASENEYVDGNGGSNITFSVVEQSGPAELVFRIKSPTGSRSMGVYVNDIKVGNVTTLLTSWNDKTVTATLNSGTNIIELRDSEGTNELDVDYLEVTNTNSSTSFTPDPTKTYYIDNPHHNLRLAATGESEDAYTKTTSTTGDDVTWQFVDRGNGSWHIQRAAGGTKPRLRTDNTSNVDMQATTSRGVYTYFDMESTGSANTYFFTLPNGPSNYKRLQVDNSGNIKMVTSSHNGSWETFTITEAGSATSTKNSKAIDVDFKVYPNPTESIITIKGAKNATIHIYDMNSRFIMSQEISSDSETMDLSKLSVGMYHAQVQGVKNIDLVKIIKK